MSKIEAMKKQLMKNGFGNNDHGEKKFGRGSIFKNEAFQNMQQHFEKRSPRNQANSPRGKEPVLVGGQGTADLFEKTGSLVEKHRGENASGEKTSPKTTPPPLPKTKPRSLSIRVKEGVSPNANLLNRSNGNKSTTMESQKLVTETPSDRSEYVARQTDLQDSSQSGGSPSLSKTSPVFTPRQLPDPNSKPSSSRFVKPKPPPPLPKEKPKSLSELQITTSEVKNKRPPPVLPPSKPNIHGISPPNDHSSRNDSTNQRSSPKRKGPPPVLPKSKPQAPVLPSKMVLSKTPIHPTLKPKTMVSEFIAPNPAMKRRISVKLDFVLPKDPLPLPKPLDVDTTIVNQMLIDRSEGKIKPPEESDVSTAFHKQVDPPKPYDMITNIKLPSEQSKPLQSVNFSGLTPEQIEELKNSFFSLDIRGEGKIPKTVITELYQDVLETDNIPPLPKDGVTFSEYVQLMKEIIVPPNQISRKSIESTLSHFKDESGRIPMDKLKEIVFQHEHMEKQDGLFESSEAYIDLPKLTNIIMNS